MSLNADIVSHMFIQDETVDDAPKGNGLDGKEEAIHKTKAMGEKSRISAEGDGRVKASVIGREKIGDGKSYKRSSDPPASAIHLKRPKSAGEQVTKNYSCNCLSSESLCETLFAYRDILFIMS